MMMRERYEKKHSVSHDVVELFENVEFGETMLVVDIAVFPIKKCYRVWGARRKRDINYDWNLIKES